MPKPVRFGPFLGVELDNVTVNGIDDLHRALTAERIGREAPLTVLRGTRLLTLKVRPAEMA